MTMQRRDFLKLSAACGLSLVAPMSVSSIARAEEADYGYDGPLWIFINATGGWDPTMLWDPKGGSINPFSTADIAQVGAFDVAPFTEVVNFTTKYQEQLTVINGVDVQTLNHGPGRRHTWSGQLGAGYPASGAVMAGALNPHVPMSFLADGMSYENTMDLVQATRPNQADLGFVNYLGNPTWIDEQGNGRYHSDSVAEIIAAKRLERLDALRVANSLPRVERSMGALHMARLGKSKLKELADTLTAINTNGDPLKAGGQLAVAAYQAGLAVSCSLAIDGFDTHNNHDVLQRARLGKLLEGIDFIMNYAVSKGLGDKVVFVVGSDFARTPAYNGGNGKDHWAYTSMFTLGTPTGGQRVVGATTDSQGITRVKPGTLEVVDDGYGGDSVRIRPAHVHAGLRKLAGIETHDISSQYPMEGGDIGIFADV